MTKYTVIDNNGSVLGSGLCAELAADIVLTYDSQEYKIRRNAEANSWEIWTRKQCANKPWAFSGFDSYLENQEAAEQELYQAVIDVDFGCSPSVMTDEQYARMQEEGEGL